MKSNNSRGFAELAVPEMAADRVSNHGANLFNGFTLSSYSMAERRRDVATVCFVFTHFEDDFAHPETVNGSIFSGKSDAQRFAANLPH